MEEIKINPNKLINGEYVRTNRGTFDRYITKHKDSSNDYSWYTFENRGNITNPENYVVKHSPNIIELIEEGDYVNGIKVTGIMSGYVYLDKIDIETKKVKTLTDYQIKDIVTKEQFNQVKYEV